ncbi:DUF2812 domain-containing protein [Bacillus carboniphilus]|uniref:DUF2812 domain-containing protein n=1 Tax=Bacillus carboniphilus TaxID=86663 RepID=A0ABY9JV77_9BACI|nr:DUF2812 domain-containing protein [Bacillus carboniphilus]WLR42403.1 DUF2812 domain-containing protein [Bacillus carboniphilus]
MKKKIKRKFRSLNQWHVEEYESWLTDMAKQGWKLIKINSLWATFEQCEPETINYRIDIKENNSTYKDKIELFKQEGWEYVDRSDVILIFRGKMEELYAEPKEQAKVFNRLKKKAITNTVSFAVVTIIYFLNLFLIYRNPVTSYLNNNMVFIFCISLFFFILSLNMIANVFHTQKLINKLRSGVFLNHRTNYKKKKVSI